MSSLHEPQVGQALEPEVSATAATADLLNNQRNTRPFSASDECGGDLLTVLVHFGRNLGALVTKQVLTKLDTLNSNTVAGEQLNTYVVASVGAFAVSSDLVQCLRGRDAKAPDTSTPVLEGRVLYEQKFSPYAATRVVEGSTSPSWNEVLAIPLPAEWSESLTTNQQRPDRGGGGGGRAGLTTHTEAGKCLALKLELVERGDSHQEEFLLGTCILPLAKIGCQFQQTRLALAFPSAGTKRPALLREQLAHLQTEGTAQRLQIERLQNELDIRLAAIKTCGLEIVALRREARQKDEQLQKLKEQAEFAQRREQQQLAELLASTNGNGIAFPARPEHQAASQRFTLLATKYKELDHECQTVKQQLADAQRSLDSCADLETRHNKLQEAHLVQSALVQRLQRDKQHATTLKKAVRMQEKVIRQFEQTVAQQSTETPERPSIRQHAPETDTPDIDGGDSETREALLRVRVQVLEQQLQTNAREAAAEMSALRLRILELETAESRRTGK
ncbi:hypothetical protein PC128_g13112 [Phytophthora cactorum]|nr:hypothetical protein PC128_g13112 [Phytophthora cactorum]